MGDDTGYGRYLSSAQSVLDSARLLLSEIGSGTENLQPALDDLYQMALQHEEGGDRYRALMFSELRAAGGEDQSERVTEDVLANILADVQVANVLIETGKIAGENNEQASPADLHKMVVGLDDTLQAIQAQGEDSSANRYYFGESASPEETDGAATPADRFTNTAGKTLDDLVTEAQGVVNLIVKKMKKLDPSKIAEALSNLGAEVPQLASAGRFFNRGITLLRKAINSLIELFNKEALESVKDRVSELWEKVRQTDPARTFLEWSFNTGATRELIRSEASHLQGLEDDLLEAAYRELNQLRISFKKSMGIASGLTTAIGISGGLLVFALTPPVVALITASAYVLTLAGIVLLGMDYTDSGFILRRVKGVGEIVRGLLE
jgi:hypothetical protein